MMKKILLGVLYSIILAFLVSKIALMYFTIEEKIVPTPLSDTKLTGNSASVINIIPKQQVAKTVDSTIYLNSWKLMATVIGKSSYALVVREKESKVLRIDDFLEGFRIVTIEKDRILCSNTTQDIWLNMKQDTIVDGGIVVPIQDPTAFDLRKAMLDNEFKNPDRLLQQVSIVPILDGPEFKGLKVNRVLEGSFLYMYGLRKDDVLKKYNGRTLTSLSDAMGVYQNVLSSKKFSITVLRNNEEKELTYEVR